MSLSVTGYDGAKSAAPKTLFTKHGILISNGPFLRNGMMAKMMQHVLVLDFPTTPCLRFCQRLTDELDSERFDVYRKQLKDVHDFDPVEINCILRDVRTLVSTGKTTANNLGVPMASSMKETSSVKGAGSMNEATRGMVKNGTTTTTCKSGLGASERRMKQHGRPRAGIRSASAAAISDEDDRGRRRDRRTNAGRFVR